jgi:hypothetical protein
MALGTILNVMSHPSAAQAADAALDEGRLIEFEVANLDGVEGETGKFVIQTRPSWAPIGAKRFEVRDTHNQRKSKQSMQHGITYFGLFLFCNSFF